MVYRTNIKVKILRNEPRVYHITCDLYEDQLNIFSFLFGTRSTLVEKQEMQGADAYSLRFINKDGTLGRRVEGDLAKLNIILTNLDPPSIPNPLLLRLRKLRKKVREYEAEIPN